MSALRSRGPLIPLSEQQARFWRTVMEEHRNVEVYGCRLCRVRNCARHTEARARLAMAGEVLWDPLRDRYELAKRQLDFGLAALMRHYASHAVLVQLLARCGTLSITRVEVDPEMRGRGFARRALTGGVRVG